MGQAWYEWYNTFTNNCVIFSSISVDRVYSSKTPTPWLSTTLSTAPSFSCSSRNVEAGNVKGNIDVAIHYSATNGTVHTHQRTVHTPLEDCLHSLRMKYLSCSYYFWTPFSFHWQCIIVNLYTQILVQWNLIITRSLGPWKSPCYIRVKKQRNIKSWD